MCSVRWSSLVSQSVRPPPLHRLVETGKVESIIVKMRFTSTGEKPVILLLGSYGEQKRGGELTFVVLAVCAHCL